MVFSMKEEKQVKKSVPVGIILVLIYVALGFLGHLQSFQNPAIQLGPKVFMGVVGVLYNLIGVVALGFVFYGILKRKRWGKKLGIIWYVLVIVLGIVNVIFFIADPSIYDELYTSLVEEELVGFMTSFMRFFVPFTAGIGIILSLVIVIYLIKKQGYFENG